MGTGDSSEVKELLECLESLFVLKEKVEKSTLGDDEAINIIETVIERKAAELTTSVKKLWAITDIEYIKIVDRSLDIRTKMVDAWLELEHISDCISILLARM